MQEDNQNNKDGVIPLKNLQSKDEAIFESSDHPRGYCWGKDNPVPQEAGKKICQDVQTWRWARDSGPGYVDGLRRAKVDSEVRRKVPEDLRRYPRARV